MLITCAGVGFAGTPSTMPPDAHTTASEMSLNWPPQWPSTRIGNSCASPAIPAMPTPLLVTAAMVPATCVPCQLLGAARHPAVDQGGAWGQSPGSQPPACRVGDSRPE